MNLETYWIMHLYISVNYIFRDVMREFLPSRSLSHCPNTFAKNNFRLESLINTVGYHADALLAFSVFSRQHQKRRKPITAGSSESNDDAYDYCPVLQAINFRRHF